LVRISPKFSPFLGGHSPKRFGFKQISNIHEGGENDFRDGYLLLVGKNPVIAAVRPVRAPRPPGVISTPFAKPVVCRGLPDVPKSEDLSFL
jgi:hypothetical protein